MTSPQATYSKTPKGRAATARYRETAKWKATHARIAAAYRSANRAKAYARRVVSNAIAAGTLRPEPCEQCGDARSEAHHPDYSRPLWVVWLCQYCHKALHAA